ncbi:rhodanese-like domain-containing protein [Thiohalobacter sp. IOR34]|uniref:rhodanese-like domain-containing protein n=1 Tax=Thiohalobacter sp. IOR34 TaxID=3057176 RepID=UPI0025B20AA2|nr:rhodanese-like domain-containing protein [Thiohalobacter sp. IOR34]WJW76804.1 rhodanese-like domain-containing protein [Thiohalobacter sp. IOR34]
MYTVNEIDSQTLAETLAENPQAVRLIDVRSPAEMAQGIIPGSEPLPLHLLPLQADTLLAGDRPLVIYCRSGARSAQACMFLAGRGGNAQRILNLRGGIIDWVRQGNQVVSPEAGRAVG